MKKKKILLGFTTTPYSNWHNKIKEIEKFQIKEIAFFPTFLKKKERQKLYWLLEETCLEKMPHVHLRDDMDEEEISYFVERFSTSRFNIHCNMKAFKVLENLSSFWREKIFLENQWEISQDFLEMLNLCGGLCIDFSHWEEFGFYKNNQGYDQFSDLARKYQIGCCHISAVRKLGKIKKALATNFNLFQIADHTFCSLEEFEYLLKYQQYLPDIISLELENSLEEQILVKNYLEEKIDLSL